MPADTHMDLKERVAALEQLFVARTAEHGEGLQQESATRLSHPPPRWGRARVRVTDRLAVRVTARTGPW